MEYSVTFDARPFGLAVCDAIDSPAIICLVMDDMNAGQLGVRTGSVILEMRTPDEVHEIRGPMQARELMGTGRMPIEMRLRYDVDEVRQVAGTTPRCQYWSNIVAKLEDDMKELVVATREGIIVMESPGVSSEEIGKLEFGQRVVVKETAGAFVRVSLPDDQDSGEIGWCKRVTADMRHILQESSEFDQINTKFSRMPSLQRQLSDESFEMKFSGKGEFLRTSDDQSEDEFWIAFSNAILESAEFYGFEIGFEVAQFIASFALVPTIQRTDWDFEITLEGGGDVKDVQGKQIADYLMNGKPTAVFFCEVGVVAPKQNPNLALVESLALRYLGKVDFIIVRLFEDEDTLEDVEPLRYFDQVIEHCVVGFANSKTTSFFKHAAVADQNFCCVCDSRGMVLDQKLNLNKINKYLKLYC